jgi:hypothetical protein
MNDTIGMVVDRQARPAYATFERVPVEDVAASKKAGRYVAVDVDYVHITPAFSNGNCEIIKEAIPWLDQNDRDAAQGRLNPEWASMYRKQYEAWKNGQEMPLMGTAIKGWGMISPAQQEMLIRIGIRTIEDLAAVNEDGLRHIGMGGINMKHKAQGWLAQNTDKGPLTQEIASVKSENASLAGQVETLQRQVKELLAMISTTPPMSLPQVESVVQPVHGFAAEDIGLTETPPPANPLPFVVPPVETAQEKPKRHRRTRAEMDAARAIALPPAVVAGDSQEI